MPFGLFCLNLSTQSWKTDLNREMHHHNHLPGRPCLHCHPNRYIRMVQHLIEKCLLFHMSRDQCIKALERHANITPLITLTVWRELQKENRHFFQAYFHSISPIRSHIQNAPRFAGIRKYWK